MRRVLVVDDDPAVRELVAAFLTDQPVHVVHAGSGEEALALTEHDDASLDVVVSDVELPGICGYETVNRLLERFPRLRPIIISGAADGAGRHRRSGELSAFLEKPFERRELIQLVSAALDAAS
jgi:two-component system, OmpR family, response regulator